MRCRHYRCFIWSRFLLLTACLVVSAGNAMSQTSQLPAPQLHELQMLAARAANAYRSGRLQTAISLSTVVVEGARLRFGDGHLRYAQALSNLALFQDLSGALPQAEQNYRHAIRIVEALDGKHPEQLAEFKNNLAAVVLQNCHIEEARRLYAESLKLTIAVYGGDHREAHMVRANIRKLDAYIDFPSAKTFSVKSARQTSHASGIKGLLSSCAS